MLKKKKWNGTDTYELDQAFIQIETRQNEISFSLFAEQLINGTN